MEDFDDMIADKQERKVKWSAKVNQNVEALLEYKPEILAKCLMGIAVEHKGFPHGDREWMIAAARLILRLVNKG